MTTQYCVYLKASLAPQTFGMCVRCEVNFTYEWPTVLKALKPHAHATSYRHSEITTQKYRSLPESPDNVTEEYTYPEYNVVTSRVRYWNVNAGLLSLIGSGKSTCATIRQGLKRLSQFFQKRCLPVSDEDINIKSPH